MYIFKSKGTEYGVIDLLYNYPRYLEEYHIIEIFDNIADCSGCLFDLYVDLDDVTVDEKIVWMVRNKYCRLEKLCDVG
jgi:predicted RNA-binding protein associated with RNAse of E/G family